MMAARPHPGMDMAAHIARPWFADCQKCGKLTLQTGGPACQDRSTCHGVIIDIRAIAETERGACTRKPAA